MQDEESAEITIPAIEGPTPPSATSSALNIFYADRKRMWSNVLWITFGHFGTALSMTIVEPLMNCSRRWGSANRVSDCSSP